MDIEPSSQEPVLDYSQLSEIYLQDMRPSERDKHEAEFKQRTGALLAEIERTAPNLKALDQYDMLQRKEKEVTEKFEATRKEEREISDKYNSIKQRRYAPMHFSDPPLYLSILSSARTRPAHEPYWTGVGRDLEARENFFGPSSARNAVFSCFTL
jgi:hypothetical protein